MHENFAGFSFASSEFADRVTKLCSKIEHVFESDSGPLMTRATEISFSLYEVDPSDYPGALGKHMLQLLRREFARTYHLNSLCLFPVNKKYSRKVAERLSRLSDDQLRTAAQYVRFAADMGDGIAIAAWAIVWSELEKFGFSGNLVLDGQSVRLR